MRVNLEVDPLPQSSLQMIAALIWFVISGKALSQKHEVKLLPKFRTYRNCKIISIPCFKPLNIGVIYNMTIDD